MALLENKYLQPFKLLNNAVDEFIREINKHKLTDRATDEWTVKDELCHIVFWHNYYAQNYEAQAKGKLPFVFTSNGGSTRNQDGVNVYRHKTKKYLIEELSQAQNSLYKSIVIKKVPNMTYRIGTEYTSQKFLEIVTGHIQSHMKLIKEAKSTIVN